MSLFLFHSTLHEFALSIILIVPYQVLSHPCINNDVNSYTHYVIYILSQLVTMRTKHRRPCAFDNCVTNTNMNYFSYITVELPCRQDKKEEIWLSPMTKAPTPTEMSKGQSDNTNNATKSSIKQRLRTDLGRSVRVTTATQLVWLTWFTSPTFPLPGRTFCLGFRCSSETFLFLFCFYHSYFAFIYLNLAESHYFWQLFIDSFNIFRIWS